MAVSFGCMNIQLIRRCTHCGSTNVRRSGRLESEAGLRPFHSPYRCRDCDRRFWVVSRRTLYGAAAGCAIFVLAAIAWSTVVIVARHEVSANALRGPSPPSYARPQGAARSDARVLGDAWPSRSATPLDGPAIENN